MIKCLLPFRAFHALGWPRREDCADIQTCVHCGKRFPARVRFEVRPILVKNELQGELAPCNNKSFTTAA